MFLFARVNIAYPENFSAGLAFVDDDGNEYRIVRCNNSHPEEHENRMEGDVIPPETSHIHTATERYTDARRYWHDHFAVVEPEPFGHLEAAINRLAEMVNLQPEGRLFL